MDDVQNISQCLGRSGTWSVVENGQLTTIAKPGWFQQLLSLISTGSYIRPQTTLTDLGNYIFTHMSTAKIDVDNAARATEIRDALVDLKKKAKNADSKASLENAIQFLNTSLETWRTQAQQDPVFTKLNLWCYGDVKVTREEAQAFAEKEELKDLAGLHALLIGAPVQDSDLAHIARRLATEQLLNQKGTSLEQLKDEGRISAENYTRLQKGFAQLLETSAPPSRPQFTVRINFS